MLQKYLRENKSESTVTTSHQNSFSFCLHHSSSPARAAKIHKDQAPARHSGHQLRQQRIEDKEDDEHDIEICSFAVIRSIIPHKVENQVKNHRFSLLL